MEAKVLSRQYTTTRRRTSVRKALERNSLLRQGWYDRLTGLGFPWEYDDWPEVEQKTYELGRACASLLPLHCSIPVNGRTSPTMAYKYMSPDAQARFEAACGFESSIAVRN